MRDNRSVCMAVSDASGASGLTSLADVSLGRSLRVLYLYDNQLTCLQGLDGLCQLTHLYLQNNRLSSLGGLGHLPALQKLYLDGNCIERIDSLQGCTRLQELHLQPKYRADMSIAGQALVELDGKPIKPQEREFLTRLRSRSRRISSHSVDENVVPRTQHHQYPPLQCGTIGSKKGLVSGTLC
ncbi:hypothetical protein WJX72_001748 [[Myrmecia] bisecta]|uniref:Leucine-rich repeat-containing protein 56 n=1 Tax=[Myrmecia] bisecta TaxID=41462 RepID=A0AAW1PJH5_9CHLO